MVTWRNQILSQCSRLRAAKSQNGFILIPLLEFIKYRNESVFKCGKVHVSTGLYMPVLTQTSGKWDNVKSHLQGNESPDFIGIPPNVVTYMDPVNKTYTPRRVNEYTAHSHGLT